VDTGRSKPKARFAQQLVEFALVVPVILTVIIVIIEFGFALNARASLTEAVKMSLPIANQLIHRSDGSTGTIINKEIVQEEIRNTIKNYFQNHNLPYHNTITVDILGIDGTDIAVVIANYTYKPFFSLPFNKILPNNGFHFRTYQIISDKTYAPNTAPSPLSTNQLASFWKTPGNLDGRRGLLKNSSINGISTEDVKKRIAFLVSFESGHQYARLFNWWGEDLLPSGLIIDFSTGNLSVKSPYYSTSFKDTKIPFVWVLTSLGFTHAVYIKDLSDHNLVNHRLNLSSNDSNLNRGITWCNQSGLFSGDCDSDDFSSDEVDNLIKRGISFLFNLTFKPYGS